MSDNDVDVNHLTADTLEQWLLLEQDLLEAGYEPHILSTLRTCQKQNELYGIGRGDGDARAQVTKARGCVSWHVMGRALDVILYRDGVKVPDNASYAVMGDLAKARGWKWGGDFKGFPDLVHIEWHPGMTIEEACPDPDDCERLQAESLAAAASAASASAVDARAWVAMAIVAASSAGIWWALRR